MKAKNMKPRKRKAKHVESCAPEGGVVQTPPIPVLTEPVQIPPEAIEAHQEYAEEVPFGEPYWVWALAACGFALILLAMYWGGVL